MSLNGRSRVGQAVAGALAGPLLMMALRGLTLVSRFALTVFVAKFLGLAELGVLGLVQAAAVLAPAALGLGLNGVLYRQVVDIPWGQALPKMLTRLSVTGGMYLVALPLLLVGNVAAGELQPAWLVAMLVLIVGLEHLGNDVHGLLIGREWPRTAALLLFVRGGVWPLAFMTVAWLWPEARTLPVLLGFWLGGLGLATAGLLLGVTWHTRWQGAGWSRGWLRASLPKVGPFYLFDLGAATQVSLDRLVVGALLGVQAAGVYTFFWTLANGLHSLVSMGILQQYVPQLVKSARQGKAALAACIQRQQTQLWGALAVMVPVFGAAVWLAVPYVGRLELESQGLLWAVMLLATALRLGADSWHAAVYALQQDRAIGWLAVLNVGVGWVAVSVLSVIMGLSGAALAGVLTMIMMLGLRVVVTRRCMRTGAMHREV